MGVVWLAQDQKLDELVTLKFLPESVMLDEKSLADLKREVKRSRELTHKNIVRIHDIEQTSESAAIVMEYVEGDTLSALSMQYPDRAIPVEDLEPILPQVCSALDYAHQEAHIVHRDIKPANIMVTKGGRVKLADFGVARSLSDTKSRMTQIGASAGTMAYMSPQQLMGERPQAADDIYSLGAALHELLVSEPPFHSGDVATQIQHKKAPSVNAEREHLGLAPIEEKWQSLVLECLAKQPEDRPASGEEMLALLEGEKSVKQTAAKKGKNAVAAKDSNKGSKKGVLIGVVALLLLVCSVAGIKLLGSDENAADSSPVAGMSLEEAKLEAQRLEADGDLLAALETWRAVMKMPSGYDAGKKAVTELESREYVLSINDFPVGAEVLINGERTDTKNGGKLSLGLGEYTLSLKQAGYSSKERVVRVDGKGNLDINSNLVRNHGTLQLDSNLSGTRFTLKMLKSEAGEKAEMTKQYEEGNSIPTGVYTLIASNDLLSRKKEIRVHKGKNKERLDFTDYGSVSITSSIVGSSVYQDGIYQGTTPFESRNLDYGVHRFEVRSRGFNTEVVNLQLQKRKLEQHISLTKKPLLAGTMAGERREFEIAAGVKVAFRWCPPTGEKGFLMGSPAGEKDRFEDETQHKVVLTKGFWMQETEFSQGRCDGEEYL